MTAEHVRDLATYVTDDLGPSSTTALRCHRLLSVALRDAKRANRVTRNIATREFVDAPPAATSRSQVLTQARALDLLALAARSTNRGR